MRKDMKNVLHRPRQGGDGGKSIPPKGSKKRFQKTPLDEQEKFVSNAPRRVYGYECKRINESLNPLQSWLHSQISKNWNDIWSDICKGLNTENFTNIRFRNYVGWFVEKNCQINSEGKLCDSRGLLINSSFRWKQFYVDPSNNTLKIAPDNRPCYRKKPKKNWVKGKDDNHRYYLFKDVWYEIGFKPFPHSSNSYNPNRVYDMVIASTWSNKKRPYESSSEDACKALYRKSIYAATKRQLGKQEIRKLKLREIKF